MNGILAWEKRGLFLLIMHTEKRAWPLLLCTFTLQSSLTPLIHLV